MDIKKEIRGYIISIILTIVLFIVGTISWYNLHINYEKANNLLNNLKEIQVNGEVVLSDLRKMSDKKAKNINGYKFTLKNTKQDNQAFCIKLVDDYYNEYDNIQNIDNNYLRYMIKKDNGKYSEIRSLNMDGTIYYDNLGIDDNSTYELKIWVSEDYQKDFNYHGNLVIIYL